jgi:hypothetical protein
VPLDITPERERRLGATRLTEKARKGLFFERWNKGRKYLHHRFA